MWQWRQVGCFWKFASLSFRVMKDSFTTNLSILSLRLRESAMIWASESMADLASALHFLYDFVMLFWCSRSYDSRSISYKFVVLSAGTNTLEDERMIRISSFSFFWKSFECLVNQMFRMMPYIWFSNGLRRWLGGGERGDLNP